MISVLVLTKNEQQDLPGCLASVAWSDDIHVYDSGSTDDTLAIARSAGAHVTQRTYPEGSPAFGGDEAAHRNWGMDNIDFRHDWIFVIDADERVTSDLRDAMLTTVASPGAYVAFKVQRRDFLYGTWLQHVQASPYYMRLLRRGKVRHERIINTVPVADGAVGSVAGYLDHFPFSKGMDHWLARHNWYSRFEAMQIIADRKTQKSASVRTALLSRDFHERRAHQKALFYRLPMRPAIKFVIFYILKRGFLDGRAGLTYAALQSIYEYFIVLKVRELSSTRVEGASSS